MKDLQEYLNESLQITEAVSKSRVKKLIQDMYDDDGDLVSVASCFNWLDALDWEKRRKNGYTEDVMNINNDIGEDDMDYYGPVMSAMAQIGKDETLKIIKSIVKDESELEEYQVE
jgi:hypothetical protein